jgi:hypothetical protein
MNLLAVFSVAFYFVSSYSANADKVVITKGFNKSNVSAFKGYNAYHFDGKKLNPFKYDTKDVFTRFKVLVFILRLISIIIFFN